MARIPPSVIDEVRERADIVQVVGRYVTLKRAGSQYLGLCPFHDEKTPSFQVSPAKQVFYCFGCQEGGNVYSFLMRHNSLDFPEAVVMLAKDLGVAIPESREEGSGRSAALFRINEFALEFFRSALRGEEGGRARSYLVERGVPADLIDRFQIGYAPPRWDGLIGALQRGKHAERDAVEVGLIKRRETGTGHYDAFRGRVVFPILEAGGRVIGFGGRAIGAGGQGGDGPKYLNSPDSPAYRKSRVLFGLPQAIDAIRQRGRAVVVEGYFDVIALHRAGLPEAVAPCGTALTEEHARRLRRYAPEVVLLFDGDEAGERAARRSLPVLLGEGLRVRAAFLPRGEDPDTLVTSSGGSALRACVEAAGPLLDELIERAVKGLGDHAWEAADVSKELAPFISAIRDPVERAAYTRKLSSYLELPPEALDRVVRSAAADAAPRTAEPAPSTAVRVAVEPTVRTLLAAVISFPEASRHLDAVQSDWLPEGIDRELISIASEALRLHGQAAASYLLSPDSGELTAAVRAALAQIAAVDPPASLDAAHRAAGDCVAQLEKRMLDAKIRDVRAQLEACTDAAQSTALLEQQQRYMAQRRALGASLVQT